MSDLHDAVGHILSLRQQALAIRALRHELLNGATPDPKDPDDVAVHKVVCALDRELWRKLHELAGRLQ